MATSQKSPSWHSDVAYVETSFKQGKENKTLQVQCKKFQTKVHAKHKINNLGLFILLFLDTQTRSCVTWANAAPCRWLMSPCEATSTSNFNGIQYGVRCLAAGNDLQEHRLYMQFMFSYALKTCLQVEKHTEDELFPWEFVHLYNFRAIFVYWCFMHCAIWNKTTAIKY